MRYLALYVAVLTLLSSINHFNGVPLIVIDPKTNDL
jgi:hypothetical protein